MIGLSISITLTLSDKISLNKEKTGRKTFMKILVTGTAGFIGYFLAKRLLDRGDEVVGVDNINEYYDVNLKYGRLSETGIAKEKIEYGKPVHSLTYGNYWFVKTDLEDKETIFALFKLKRFDRVCHLAAQAGVRYSLTNPYAYINSNIVGFINILEGCRHNGIEHLVFASSSSVYGLNKRKPFSVHHNVDHPVSLYAATKKSNELMAHTYAHLYSIPVTGLRFFTVYGPWGRPDMAYFIFTDHILKSRPIDIYNFGNMERDFTYIDDIVEGVVRVIDKIPEGNKNWSGERPDPSSSPAPYKVYNIGNNRPVKLMDFINILENALGRKAEKNLLPIQPGDVLSTCADVEELEKDVAYRPTTTIHEGIDRFVAWYRDYYGVT
jgi:UDP-glucuronate 4-epimerase